MVTRVELLPAVCALAREAGEAAMRIYDSPEMLAGVTRKADRSPLTLADREAHRIIVHGLAELDPDTPVISEEGEIPPFAERRAWRRFWLVDPLDGTKEFIARNGEFTVNIALIAGGEPVLGVVFAPALDLLYYATRGGGAWKEEGGGTAARIFASEPSDGAPRTVVESRSHPSAELEAFLRGVRVGRRVAVGSSLKFCWVAEGRADLYPRFGPTMEWDVAAGDCIYRNAGRSALNPSPLAYNKPDLRNDHFVIGR